MPCGCPIRPRPKSCAHDRPCRCATSLDAGSAAILRRRRGAGVGHLPRQRGRHEAEKSYFGADASQYDARSAYPGILNIETPLLLAWSAQDPPRLVAEGEKLKESLCNSATHSPHTTVLGNRESLASVFWGGASGGGLAQPTLELVREIEARGLP